MLAQLSHLLLIATLSQSPQEAAWLKVVPADVDIAIRLRGMDETRNHVLGMLKAMNPDWANMAEGSLRAATEASHQKYGEHSVKDPWVGLVRFGDPDAPGSMGYAIVVSTSDYKGVLNGVSGGKDPELKHQDGGYDEFASPDGNGSWYAAKGPGVVAFGPSKSLIASVGKGGGKTLDSVVKESAAKTFLADDIGIYVNAGSLSARFADQIDQGRNLFMGALDQAAQQQPGQEAMMTFVKDFYGGLFDSVKYADAVVVGLGVAEKGLNLSGVLNVKADAPAAKSIAGIHTSTAAPLGNFPLGAMAYMYMDLEAKTFERLQGMSLRMLSSGKPSPELEKAMAELHGLGRIETTGSASFGKNGMSVINDIIVSDPKKYLAASEAMLRAMKGGEGQLSFFKDVKVEPDVQTHQGLTFTKIVATIDLEKLAHIAGNNPSQAETMKSMFGGGTATYWYGTDGKQRLLQVMSPTFDEVKTQIDGYLKGAPGISATRGFQSVRSELPKQASLLVLFEIQGFIKMVANQLATTLNKPALKLPDEVTKEPAFVGGSITPLPPLGFEFHLVIPTAVGTAIHKGITPLIQGLAQ